MEQSIENLYKLDGRVPVAKALPFGLQHVLAMFVSNIAPIMILAGAVGLDSSVSAVLIQNCMIIAGIGTLVQLYPVWRIGSRLPIVMGISFTFLSLAISIAAAKGMGTLMGAVIIGGLVEGTLGLFAKYWIKLIPHVVAATVVTAIGFSLLPIGANSFAGGQGAADFGSMNNWIVGSVTLLSCLLCQIFAKGFLRSLSVLVGLIVGYVLSENSVKNGGGPFGAVIAKNGVIVAEASNSVTIDNDPTAHAEVNAIRQATRALKTFNLEGCEIYTSCEPCPMCLGAIYWAHLDRIYYANDRKDAAKIGFDDEFIYEEIGRKIEDRHRPMIALMRDEALGAFRMWEENTSKTEY